MKNKLSFIIIFSFLFLFCGCSSKKDEEAREQYGIPIPVQGLEWGMDKESVLKLLDGDYTVTEDDGYIEILLFDKTVKAFGQDAKLYANFTKNVDSAGEKLYQNLGEEILSRVSLIFSEEAGKKALEEVEKQYGTTEEKYWNIEGSSLYEGEQVKSIKDEKLKELAFETVVKAGQYTGSDKNSWLETELNKFYIVPTKENGYSMDFLGTNIIYIIDAQKGLEA